MSSRSDRDDPFSLWHIPRPGPGYWDFRCLTCDRPISSHPTRWQRIKFRWLGRI